MKKEQRRRVLFIVPTLVLVQQTYKVLRKQQPTWYVIRKSSRHNINSNLSTILKMYEVRQKASIKQT